MHFSEILVFWCFPETVVRSPKESPQNLTQYFQINRVLETHLFDFDKNIYSADLRVALIEFIRTEQKFDGVESLKTQIQKDISQSKLILASKTKENN